MARFHHVVCYLILFRLAVFLFFRLPMMSGTRTQKNCRKNRSGRKLWTIFVDQAQIASYRTNGWRPINGQGISMLLFHLQLLFVAPSLAGADRSLSCGIRINFNNQHIQINGNNLHCVIRYDPVLKLSDLEGKHNAKIVFHNNITPPVRSSIHFYQVHKK